MAGTRQEDPTIITRENAKPWMRLAAAVQYGGGAALVRIWQSGTAMFLTGLSIPNDSRLLHNAIQKIFRNEKEIRRALNLNLSQKSLVLPASRKTEVKVFDITLHAQLLLNMTTIKNEVTPDVDKLDAHNPCRHYYIRSNLKTGDYINFLKQFRNIVMHYPANNMSQDEFLRYWDTLEWILDGLGYNSEKIMDLKMNIPQDDSEVKVAVNRAKVEQAAAQFTANFNTMIVMNDSGVDSYVEQVVKVVERGADIVVNEIQNVGNQVMSQIQGDAQGQRECMESMRQEISTLQQQIQQLLDRQ